MTALAEEKAREEQFRAALEQLETCAGTPMVPGELRDWLQAVEEAVATFKPHLERQIGDVHRAELAQIKREDQEMFRHVEELQAEDRQLIEKFRALQDRLPVLRQLAERVEPDEKRAAVAVDEFSEHVLQFAVRIRKQEVAIRTWLMEAFTRDRGVVD